MTEIYEIPQGKLIISISDKKHSIGLLVLKPSQELPKHNRSVNEGLTQVYGNCNVKLFGKNKLSKEMDLKEDAYMEIPANQFHIHSNKTKKASVTLWEFEGDVTEVIENIRINSKRIL